MINTWGKPPQGGFIRLSPKIKCQNCGFKIKTYEEKESDVRVATGMLTDVFTKQCDITIVVSADSDMIPSVEIIKDFAPEHPVHVFVPPTQITLSNGHVLKRPENWK